MPRAPSLLVLGHVARDRFGVAQRIGGAAAYAARAAVLLGVPTRLVTVAPPDAPELGVLRGAPELGVSKTTPEHGVSMTTPEHGALAPLELACAPSPCITTFTLDYHGAERALSLALCARPLTLADVPERWREPDVVFAGSVAGEVDADLVRAFPNAYVIAGLQGWLREPTLGRVRPRLLPEACDVPPSLRVATLSEADHPRAHALAAALAARGVIVAVTAGKHGAHVCWSKERTFVPAAPAREVDPTGAGDVFALVFGLALYAGCSPERAGELAALAAARVVEGPELGNLAQALRALRLWT